KQTRSKTHHKITMRHLLLKHSPGKIGCLYMRIKMIAAKVSEFVYVFRCNNSFFSNDLVTDLQLFKIFFKWMLTRVFSFCMLLVNSCYFSKSCWRTLQSCSLHIMFYTAKPAHFFTPACPTGTTMNQQWQR